ncbi:6-phosphogluconate dehydrogenase [Aspergillus cavernicola]|uniref:6-phosphogluconate dehydrogenase n=1 Tax=Aspergillus cavernicola TaxID=176166 RepID=A0ABR4IZA9_9EURO
MALAFLGCGTLSSNSSASTEDASSLTPTKFIACVRGAQSAGRIQEATSLYPTFSVKTLQNDNISGIQQADSIILGCKPYMLKDVLDSPGIRDALKGKILISILAGVSAQEIEEILYPDSSFPAECRCRVVRAMPNTAAMVRESMTVISTCPPPPHRMGEATWVSIALAGSGPEFMALALEGIADGAVAMGLPRAEARLMAAQHPAQIKEKISTPCGCTIGGLLVLEENAVRGSMARAVREAIVVASQLGQGVKNVNGTRF